MTEGSMGVVLMFYGGAATALAAVLLYRVISHWAVLPAGGICYLILRRRHSMVIPQPLASVGFGREPVHARHRTGYCLYRMHAMGRRMSVNDDCAEVTMSMADRPAGQPERPGSRRLTRSRTDRMIAGVCGGFAAYSGIDANIVRLVMVLLAVFGGGGVVLYLVAWVIVPEEQAGEASGNGRS